MEQIHMNETELHCNKCMKHDTLKLSNEKNWYRVWTGETLGSRWRANLSQLHSSVFATLRIKDAPNRPEAESVWRPSRRPWETLSHFSTQPPPAATRLQSRQQRPLLSLWAFLWLSLSDNKTRLPLFSSSISFAHLLFLCGLNRLQHRHIFRWGNPLPTLQVLPRNWDWSHNWYWDIKTSLILPHYHNTHTRPSPSQILSELLLRFYYTVHHPLQILQSVHLPKTTITTFCIVIIIIIIMI